MKLLDNSSKVLRLMKTLDKPVTKETGFGLWTRLWVAFKVLEKDTWK